MLLWKLVYDNGDDESGKGTDSKPKPTLKQLIEEHNLQDELNGMMAANRKNLTQKNQELIDQLQKLRDEATMSGQAKEELEARIEELQTQHMSREELAKRESEKLTKTHAKEIEKLTGEANRWKGLFATSTIQRSLLDAAIEGEAIQPSQIVAMLGQNTQIVEDTDDTGQGKGTYKTIIKFNDVDDNKNPVILNLTPQQVIKRMKELPELYGNLFKADATSGLGSTSSGGEKGGSGSPKLSDLVKDPEKYREWRKKHPDLPIEKLRR